MDTKSNLTRGDWQNVINFLAGYHWTISSKFQQESNNDKNALGAKGVITPDILGKVFEKGVLDSNEIELKATSTPDKQEVSKRKKRGVFYTPKEVTNFICKKTIYPFLLKIPSPPSY